MWQGFDADLQRQLFLLKEQVMRRQQTPTHEWPLVFVEEHAALLVVREWPDGGLTAYAHSDIRDVSRGEDPSEPR